MYASVTRRSLSLQVEDIGVWNSVFEVIIFIGVLSSGFIAGFTSNSLDYYFRSDRFISLLVILVYEHVVLVVRYLIRKMTSRVPRWVKKRLIRAKIY
jgi:hypothetical protein